MAYKKLVGIYCIENLCNNKKYIGQSVNLLQRLNSHKNKLKNNEHENSYLQNSYNCHGSENFKYYIIQETEENNEILDLMEIYWIVYYNSYVDDGEGYNLTRGGKVGQKFHRSTREKQSDFRKGKTFRKYKRGEDADWWGKHHTEETKKKMSESAKGKIFTEEHKKNISIEKSGENHPNFGKHRSKETMQKTAEGQRGKKGKNASSKYMGVGWHKGRNAWALNINDHGERIFLGYFEYEIEAALVYNEAEMELYGWKSKLNIIPQSEIDALWEILDDSETIISEEESESNLIENKENNG